MEPHERAAHGHVPRLPISGRDPRRLQRPVPAHRLNAQRRARGETELTGGEFLKLAREQADALGIDMEMMKRAGERRLFGRREEAQRDGPDGHHRSRASPSSTRPTAASTSTRCASSARASTAIMREPDKAVLLITHYQRLLDYVTPDLVHVLSRRQDRPLGRPRARARARARRL